MKINYQFWRQTGLMKPFQSVEEFEQFTSDLIKLPSLSIYANTALHKSNIKKGFLDGEKFDSKWEAAFYIYAKDIKGWTIRRNKKEQFLIYIDSNNKQRKFYPDFICNNEYYEIKGQWRENDNKKSEQHPEVHFITSPEIDNIIKIVNIKFPNWKDRYLMVS